MAREEGFGNINCDLIAGLPSETLEDFQATIEHIIGLSPESVTVHTMSVKRASRLNEQKESFVRTADDTVAAMIDLARDSLQHAGYKPYYLYRQKNILANLENVGYAKPGYEGIYNILIMEEIQSILALGAGAISKVVFPGNRIERIFNVKNVEQYIQRIDEMLERKEAMLGNLL
jgi:oxygen-independent coproporphyrinogen-3 oxidase